MAEAHSHCNGYAENHANMTQMNHTSNGVTSMVSDLNQMAEQKHPHHLAAPEMSQWSKVEKNQFVLRQMQSFYHAHFPMEVRYFLCQWIEEQPWDQIDETSSQYMGVAKNHIHTMLELLQQKIAELNSPEFFVIRIQLEQSVQKLESIAKINPLELVRVIKDCLKNEQRLIEQAELAEQQQQQMNQELIGAELNDVSNQIQTVIQTLMQKTKETEAMSKDIQSKQESFIICFSDGQQLNSQLSQLQNVTASNETLAKEKELKTQKTKVDQNLNRLATELLQLRMALAHKYEETITALQELQKQILDDELMAWKRRQQLAGNGLVINSSSLETLQQWCEDLADLIWQNRQQIKKSSQLQQQLPIKFPEGEIDRLPKLNDTITGLLSSLVTSTFIVEQQPPQVLKKDARFGAVVRLLVGGKLNVHMNPPHVLATIISESQAKHLLNNDVNAKTDTSGDILNNSGTMEYQSNTGQLSINLRNMTLKKIRRMDKKGSEAVTEEKFCILFQSEFSVGGNELVFQVWTLSLPVVVTVHGNQECNATATVLWDNAFAEPGRYPFVVPDQVEWTQLADQLNMKFRSSTGKGLSETNQAYIASKLFGNKDPNKCFVTWSQFNKDTLTGKPFTFWEWFYAIQKLTKEHLKDLWVNDAIIGFLSKDQAKTWLSSEQSGTFLLRFSDSESGGITIAWLGEGNEVWHLAPFSSKDFHIRGLADRIKDLNNLTRLYPNKEKNAVFSKYYTNTSDTESLNKDDYVKAQLKTTIPKLSSSSQDDMIGMPFSPDPVYISPPGSVTQPDMMMDDRAHITPIVDSMTDMDINSFTDYMPDDIEGADMGDQILESATVDEVLASLNFSIPQH